MTTHIREELCASGLGWALVLAGGATHLLDDAIGLGVSPAALAVGLAALAFGPGLLLGDAAVRWLCAENPGRALAWLRGSTIAGGGLLGVLLLGGLVHGFGPEGVVAGLGALTLVRLGRSASQFG